MIVGRLSDSPGRGLELARVLLVDDDVANRLTLQTLLRAGGYRVDVAASAAEAVEKMDSGQYTLVLSDLELESPEAGLKVLAHAKMKEYRPATSLIKAYRDSKQRMRRPAPREVFVQTRDLASLLTKVADLIGLRAMRRSARQLRQTMA
jgi:CheY-like chemotaxis protein